MMMMMMLNPPIHCVENRRIKLLLLLLPLLGSGLLILSSIARVDALSGTHRRPPRIRPRRQQTRSIPAVSGEEPSIDERFDRNINGNGNSNNNSNNNADDRDELGVVCRRQQKHQQHEQALQDPSLLTSIRFSDRTDIHPDTRKALEEGFGLQAMTRVQALTYEAALDGRSILARSGTGTGKTLAFLLPTIERLLDVDLDLYQPGRSIGCIILAPTRELAIQIADQAEILFEFHNRNRRGNRQLSVACIYGGVKMQRDIRLLTGEYRGAGRGDLPTILVSTPARLLEHLEGNSPLNKSYRTSSNRNSNRNLQEHARRNSFADVVAETKIVVLDETDRLLQKSNQHETQRILSFMARVEKRQTLLFSATIPRAVRRLISTSSIMSKTTKKRPNQKNGRSASSFRDDRNGDGDGFFEVDCVAGNGDLDERANRAPGANPGTASPSSSEANVGNEDAVLPLSTTTSSTTTTTTTATATTHRERSRIEESFAVLENMSQFIPTLLTIIRREKLRNSQNYKILVFFPAGRMVRFLFQFFTIGGIESSSNIIWEIHSRMSQSSRSRASSAFRNARNGILFSSDVSARGLDYPDVSLVVQMGAPSTDQDYIHRIGRTGRAGQVGRSLLVLLPFERHKKEPQQQQSRQPKKGKRRRQGKTSYRYDSSIQKDRQLSLWLEGKNEFHSDDDDADDDDTNDTRGASFLSKSLYQQCEDDLESTRLKVRSGHVVLTPGAEAAYKTFLAHYAGSKQQQQQQTSGKRKAATNELLQPPRILAHAQDFARGTGLTDAPELDEAFLVKLSIR
mmetsp:Transcript_14726/g.40975  ORF Transcript_14726/g.40975 Transcript_14726/m.40975 type:complete len:796 (+) Transcript_14726:1-2388(+)